MFKSLLLCLAPLALTGCADLFSTHLDFDDSAAATIDFKVGLEGNCAGTGTSTDEHGGVSTWTKTLRGEGEVAICHIDLVWDGAPIDLKKMHDDVFGECHPDETTDRCDPEQLELSLAVTIDAASFVSGDVTIVKEDLIAMSGRATTGDALLFQLDKSTPLPLVLGPDPGVRDRLYQAYLAAEKLPIHAEGAVDLSMADVARLQAASPTGMLHVAFTGKLGAGIDAHLD